MVKSRRSESIIQSSVKATLARRPSVSTSRRSVVISNFLSPTTAVTVPCSMPVGTALMPAFSSSPMTVSGLSGVPISTSVTGRRAMASRTQPPTKRTSAPSAVSASTTVRVSEAVNHGWGDILPVGLEMA